MKTVYNCIECNQPLTGKQRSFCSIECKNNHFLNYEAIKKRALKRKTHLIEANGSACNRCGYGACIDALSFYDEDGKTLHIDTNILANSSFEKLAKRAVNAQVLCRNCVEELSSNVVLDPSCAQDDGEKTIRKFNDNLVLCGVKPGQTIVLGVSGGVDSMVMLDLFTQSDLRLEIVVAHMNHGVRAEAGLDEELVRKAAKEHGFKFVSKTIQPPKDGNLEESLRNKRRQFLLTAANDNKAGYIALAHNANDQAETFIMNTVRGSGPAGLGAMNMSDGAIIRPLLTFSRAEIESYARGVGLVWHEDKTNLDTRYSRSYIRHRILPLLEHLNPEYLGAIGRTTHLQRQIDGHLKEEAYRIIANGDSVERLRRLDKPLLYEVIGLLYEEVKGDRQNLTLDHISKVERLISSSAGSKSLDLPENVVARRRYDRLDFYRKKAHNIPSTPRTKKLEIGTQRFGGWKISTGNQQPATSNRHALTIDANMLPRLVVRTRKPGDRIKSIGPMGRKRLQDLFVDAKIDRLKRDTWPLLTDRTTDEILWVPGLAQVKVETKTKKLLTINIVEVAHETNKEK